MDAGQFGGPRRRRTALQMLGVAAVVLALVGGAVWIAHSNDGSPASTPAPTDTPRPTSTPTPTPTPPDPTPDRAAPAIPDDFPLIKGWPPEGGDGEGITGPNRTEDPIVWEACGSKFGLPPKGSPRIVAHYSEPEDFRTRELRTFPDAQVARSYLEEIRTGLEACPVHGDAADGPETVYSTRVLPFADDVDLGGAEGFQALSFYGPAENPAVAADTAIVIQRGRSVLISLRYSEASGPIGAARMLHEDLAQMRAAIDGLCLFTRTGCGA